MFGRLAQITVAQMWTRLFCFQVVNLGRHGADIFKNLSTSSAAENPETDIHLAGSFHLGL